jgi:hypothetical protein
VDQNETSLNVQRIFECLEKHEPMGLYEFVVNPHSFGQTVENFFYISFLIRDGKIAVTENDVTGLFTIETCEPPTIEQQQESEGDFSKHQNILHLTKAAWRVRSIN